MNDSTWTWMSGSNRADQKGVYGEKGNASIENVPGSREGAVGWFDSSTQELWLCGGYGHGDGYDSTSVGASCLTSITHLKQVLTTTVLI